ncbi:MAG: ribosome biogenesis GTP-binding protein YihA/YsxC [Gemmatimonadota bacterium]|nr:ribosome biogenesis GTP-binding protein YihA/YsxC [Gemmatimonadota bacterium]
MADGAAPPPPPPPADPLVIRRLEFVGGLAAVGGWRPEEELPEIAFSGRSNVGKSTLLNRLVRRKALARVSQHPGKTREINFFRVNDAFYLVDLPGYGFARVSQTMRAEWARLIEGYLRGARELRGVVQLVDSRRDPTPDDLRMLDFLGDVGVPTIVCLTKTDKLHPRELPERLASTVRALGVDEEQVIAFSAETGAGRDELAEAIVELISQPSWKAP